MSAFNQTPQDRTYYQWSKLNREGKRVRFGVPFSPPTGDPFFPWPFAWGIGHCVMAEVVQHAEAEQLRRAAGIL